MNMKPRIDTLLRWAVIAATAGLLALAIGAAAVLGGLYDVAASRPHTQPVYLLLETAMHESVRRYASDIEEPPAPPANGLLRAAACFRELCVQCHGAPGVAPGHMGLSMQPVPGPLVDAGRRWRVRELYWITRNGIKMTGMPAWQDRLDEADMWALARFVSQLPHWSTAEYAARMQEAEPLRCERPETAMPVPMAGDPSRGQEALHRYGCRGCHMIPGVPGAEVHVGPPLAGLRHRVLIAGKLPNTADNLVHWIRFPRELRPGTAMPTLGVAESDARDMAAFLNSLP